MTDKTPNLLPLKIIAILFATVLLSGTIFVFTAIASKVKEYRMTQATAREVKTAP